MTQQSQPYSHKRQFTTTPIVLTSAGSNSSGGAGIQADIKAMSATGSFACSVITAITLQNTQGISAIFSIPIVHVENQLDTVFTYLNIAAVKIGTLADSNITQIVANKIKQYQPKYLVIAPVMVATSDDLLLEHSAISTLKKENIPIADIIPPNFTEGAAFTGAPVPESEADMNEIINDLRPLGAKAILLKGGPLEKNKNSNDLLITPNSAKLISAKRFTTKNTHCTECTLSSAIASYLGQGNNLNKAVYLANQYTSHAIAHADELEVGKGHGPVHHFFAGPNFRESNDGR